MLNLRKWKRAINSWLDEDIMEGDLSSQVLLDQHKDGQGWIIAKGEGVIAGLPLVELVYAELDKDVLVEHKLKDGSQVKKGDIISQISGPLVSILAGERLSLNLLQRLSGIASLTNQYVQKIEGLPVRIVDTRKTTPGLRGLEKYAVRLGGGYNHRFGLYDAVMIKDNHIKAAGSITEAVHAIRTTVPHTTKVEVEVESLEQVKEALKVDTDIIMLDNMDLVQMKEAVEYINHQAIVEASGGVNLSTVRGIAETGVDIISVGALTHSVTALDISMDVQNRKELK